MPREAARRKDASDPLETIRAKVWVWARWFRDRKESGYPPHSWEGRSILRGGSAPRPQDSVHALPINSQAQAVEDQIVVMDDRLKAAIVERHINRRSDRDGARKCHCSRSFFREQCTRGYWWLKGRLE